MPFDPGVLRLAVDLRRAGTEPSRQGWRQVRHGVWVPEDTWAALGPTHRHAAFVHATALRRRLDAPFVAAGTSAAAVSGLPRIEPWPQHVRHLVTHRRVRGSAIVRPLLGQEVEPVAVEGLLVTPCRPDGRRPGALVSAVAAADHALRHGLCTAADLAVEVAAIPARANGRVRAALTRDLADPLSMSPGESLSRVQMFVHNLPRPVLQVKIHDDEGLVGIGDFGWEGVVGELDGRLKYRVPEGASPEEAGEVLWREKRREDRLRRQVLVARWVWLDALRSHGMLASLARVGIRPVTRPLWFDLGAASAG